MIELSGPVTAEEGGWMYTVEDGVITVIQAPQSVNVQGTNLIKADATSMPDAALCSASSVYAVFIDSALAGTFADVIY